MKRRILAISLLLASIMLLLSSCKTDDTPLTENKSAPGFYRVIMVSVSEDSLKEMHIANVTVNNGELGLVVIKEVPDIERLRSALEEIKAKEGLLLEYEDRVGGTYYLKSELVSPTDPRYIYALEGELALHYGFRADMR